MNTNTTEHDKNSIDIDIWDFIPKLRKSMKTILIVGCVFALLGAIMAFGKSKVYQAEAELSPELSADETSNLASIASMVGISLDMTTNSEAINLMIYPNVVASRPFAMEMLEIPLHTSESAETTTLKKYLADFKGTWLERARLGLGKMMAFLAKRKKAPAGGGDDSPKTYLALSEKDVAVIDKIKKSINVDVDQKTGIMVVSATATDPVVAAIMADSVCSKLQNYITEYKTRKARQDYDYYEKMAKAAETRYKKALDAYGRYVDSNQSTILQSIKGEQEKLETEVSVSSQIYTQMEQKKELTRAKIQEVKPAFIQIDPAMVPIRATGIGRLFTTILSFIFGVVVASLWALVGKDIMAKLKER